MSNSSNKLSEALSQGEAALEIYLSDVTTEAFRSDLNALLDSVRSPDEAAIKERIIDAIRKA